MIVEVEIVVVANVVVPVTLNKLVTVLVPAVNVINDPLGAEIIGTNIESDNVRLVPDAFPK